MITIQAAMHPLLFLLNMNGGGFKFFDDKTIGIIIVMIILLHVFSIWGYYDRIPWLRVICAILYLPILIIPLVLMLFDPSFMLLFLPVMAFYYFVIIRTRK